MINQINYVILSNQKSNIFQLKDDSLINDCYSLSDTKSSFVLIKFPR